MDSVESTGLAALCTNHQVAEPPSSYKTCHPKMATVHVNGYPPLKGQAHQGWRKIPWINLRGHWLLDAGFNIGDKYQITIKDKQLILTVVED